MKTLIDFVAESNRIGFLHKFYYQTLSESR